MTPPTTAPVPTTGPARWTVARRLAGDHVAFAALLAVLGLLLAGAVTGGLALAGRTPGSVWEPATQLARWFAAGVGATIAYTQLPLHVTHGVTRRTFAGQAALSGAALVAALAALVTAGYGLEALLHDAAGWSQALSRSHLFTTPAEQGLVAVESVLLYAVWWSAGAMLGAGFYRDGGVGLLLLPAAAVQIVLSEVALGPRYLGPLTFPDLGLGPSAGVAAAVCGAACLLGLAATWAVVRDVPVRPEAA